MVGSLDGWMAGWLDGWMVGWLVGWMDGWLVAWLVGWLRSSGGGPEGGAVCYVVNCAPLCVRQSRIYAPVGPSIRYVYNTVTCNVLTTCLRQGICKQHHGAVWG